MSRFFTLNLLLKKKQKPKQFPKRIPRSILGSAIKYEHAPLFISVSLHISHWQCFHLQHTLVTYSYQSVITFGGCRDDFMVVTSQQREPGVAKKSAEKLVFVMAKPKVSVMSMSANMLSLTDWQVSTLPLHVRLSLHILLDDLKQHSQLGICVGGTWKYRNLTRK